MKNQNEEKGGDKNSTEQSEQAQASAAAQAVAFALAQGAFQLAQQEGFIQPATEKQKGNEDAENKKRTDKQSNEKQH